MRATTKMCSTKRAVRCLALGVPKCTALSLVPKALFAGQPQANSKAGQADCLRSSCQWRWAQRSSGSPATSSLLTHSTSSAASFRSSPGPSAAALRATILLLPRHGTTSPAFKMSCRRWILALWVHPPNEKPGLDWQCTRHWCVAKGRTAIDRSSSCPLHGPTGIMSMLPPPPPPPPMQVPRV